MKSKAGRRTPIVRVVRLPHAGDLALPAYHSDDAAGLDIVAALEPRSRLRLKPGARALVPTGLVLELPPGAEAQVRPRSGLALKQGITVLNSPGTIDSDYRGELKVLLINLGDASVEIRRGERIAQIVVSAVTHVRLIETTRTQVTNRGSGGFGSTGVQVAPSNKSSRKAAGKRGAIRKSSR